MRRGGEKRREQREISACKPRGGESPRPVRGDGEERPARAPAREPERHRWPHPLGEMQPRPERERKSGITRNEQAQPV